MIGTTAIREKLRKQTIGVPSWGFSDSGTRFNVYRRPYSPRTLEHRIADAAQVHKYTGVAPMIDVHTAWDVAEDWGAVRRYAESLGMRIGAVNPHLFSGNDFALGSFCNPDKRVRTLALQKTLEAVEIARRVGSRVMSMWFADGSDYPGQDDFRKRQRYLHEGLKATCDAMDDDMTMVLEYKLFEPNFYSMDLANWGAALLQAQKLGPRAKVLVDLGHHALGVNIEQIVAILLDEDRLGGFHFNDHKYSDDDLTVGAIAPYQLFLIFCELVKGDLDPQLSERTAKVALMIDENHNYKNSIEGTIQSVTALQIAYARALLVDYGALREMQDRGEVVRVEEIIKDAYLTDVRPLLAEVRTQLGIDPDPLGAFRKSGYIEKITAERRDLPAAGSLGG